MQKDYTVTKRRSRGILMRLLSSAFVAGSLLTSLAASANTHLIVMFNDGTATSFIIADKPHVSFSEKRMHIRANDVTTDYEVSAVKKFIFGDEALSVESPADDFRETRFTYTDRNTLSASGLLPGETVSLVSVEGRPAGNYNADADGSIVIDLSALPTGIYVVATKSSGNFKIKH